MYSVSHNYVYFTVTLLLCDSFDLIMAFYVILYDIFN